MELYHILNRGVERRTIFLDSQDHARFVHDLYQFNDSTPAENTHRNIDTMFELRSRTFETPSSVHKTYQRDRIVDIHGWCLMKNHYHLLLSERTTGGLTKFIRKLNVGYAMYFNERYKRSGALFQGRTKKILIKTDSHLLYILHYIHLNPLDFLKGARQWRTQNITNAKQARHHLAQYRWSSYQDYCNKKNFPSILTKDQFSAVIGNYEKTLEQYLRDMELNDIESYTLE